MASATSYCKFKPTNMWRNANQISVWWLTIVLCTLFQLQMAICYPLEGGGQDISSGSTLIPRSNSSGLVLVMGDACSDISGQCRAALSIDECSLWAAQLSHNKSSPAAKPLNKDVPVGCYLYGNEERPYFNPAPNINSAAIVCSEERTCVCQCARDRVNVAVFVGDGTTARARVNPIVVLNEQESGVRALNFTASQVQRHLNLDSYDVVLFPGGGGVGEADALGPEGMASVKAFIQSGGGYVGICAGAFLAIQHLAISVCHDIPRPDAGLQRGDGNVTLELTTTGSEQLAKLNVTQSRLDDYLIFYANGPVMALNTTRTMAHASTATTNTSGSNDTALPTITSTSTSTPFSQAEILLTFSSPSVPIEKHYVGPYAGEGAAAVCSNHYQSPVEPGPGGRVLVSGPHPETDQLDFPDRNGPASEPGTERAALLISYVKHVAPTHTAPRV